MAFLSKVFQISKIIRGILPEDIIDAHILKKTIEFSKLIDKISVVSVQETKYNILSKRSSQLNKRVQNSFLYIRYGSNTELEDREGAIEGFSSIY